MHRILQRILVVLPSLFIFCASADSPIDCVDPDIANTLLGMPGQGQLEITRSLPDRFRSIDVPSEFTLIGSRQSPYLTMVSYRADKTTVDDAKAKLRKRMAEAQWHVPERNNVPGRRGGFQSERIQRVRDVLSMCHDEKGNLSATFGEAPHASTYITLMASGQNSPGQCQLIQQMGSRIFQDRAMPTLTLPKAAKTKGNEIGGVSSSGDGATTRIALETSLSTPDLLTFFNQQLTQQDWTLDGSWIGLRSSGSVWVSDDEQRSGVLSVIEQGDATFKLVFQTTRHGTRSNPGISFGSMGTSSAVER
ncbi:MAG: hypothetical protein GKR90_14310 [Pseudomonadales bacterium]|nr:hypothetical protein [Pseudomonadales bacterium]